MYISALKTDSRVPSYFVSNHNKTIILILIKW